MPVTYLDYAATSPLLPEVIDAMHLAEEKFFANASALHTPGHLAMNEIEKTRRLLAQVIGARPSEIIFTSGASEANNTVIRTFEGHVIETSPLEHHSVLETAQQYRGDKSPKLYSYMLANNETGEICDLSEVVKHAKNDTVADWPEMFNKKTEWGKPIITVKKGGYVQNPYRRRCSRGGLRNFCCTQDRRPSGRRGTIRANGRTIYATDSRW